LFRRKYLLKPLMCPRIIRRNYFVDILPAAKNLTNPFTTLTKQHKKP